MPLAPKLRDVARKVRGIKVFHQPYAEQFAYANRHIAVTRKVAVYLNAVNDGTND